MRTQQSSLGQGCDGSPQLCVLGGAGIRLEETTLPGASTSGFL